MTDLLRIPDDWKQIWETPDAILVEGEQGESLWIPKSISENDVSGIWVQGWWYRKHWYYFEEARENEIDDVVLDEYGKP